MRLALVVVFAVLLVGSLSRRADAHGMRTAYVEVVEREGGLVRVQTRTGTSYGAVRVVMPEGCTPASEAVGTWSCERPLRGSTLRVEGLGAVVGEAVIAASLQDGSEATYLLRPGAASVTLPERAGGWATIGRYARAGFFHVLAGADHLLFLAALVVAIRRFRAIVVAETAFTLSHSIALSATALGLLHVPAAAAEAAIALSLVLLALSIGRRPMPAGEGARTALLFGAVHGLGFAGGLEDLGAPRESIVPALGAFAVGVEAAQIAFLLLTVAIVAASNRLKIGRPLVVATTYAVGAVGVFWLVERTIVLLRGALS
jgi:HupE/UreJ protein